MVIFYLDCYVRVGIGNIDNIYLFCVFNIIKFIMMYVYVLFVYM